MAVPDSKFYNPVVLLCSYWSPCKAPTSSQLGTPALGPSFNPLLGPGYQNEDGHLSFPNILPMPWRSPHRGKLREKKKLILVSAFRINFNKI